MTIVFYYFVICAWVANSFAADPSDQFWVYPLMLVIHFVIGLRIAWNGREDHYSPPSIASLLVAALGLAVPPFAPISMTLLAGGATRRAALRRADRDALGLDLAAAARFWWLTGFLAVILGVLWFYGLFLLDGRGVTGTTIHPLTDPLVVNRDRLGAAGRLVILVIATWYAFLLWRSWQMLNRHRRDPGPHPAARREATAGDAVY